MEEEEGYSCRLCNEDDHPQMIQCLCCESWFHWECVDVDEYVDEDWWLCHGCDRASSSSQTSDLSSNVLSASEASSQSNKSEASNQSSPSDESNQSDESEQAEFRQLDNHNKSDTANITSGRVVGQNTNRHRQVFMQIVNGGKSFELSEEDWGIFKNGSEQNRSVSSFLRRSSSNELQGAKPIGNGLVCKKSNHNQSESEMREL